MTILRRLAYASVLIALIVGAWVFIGLRSRADLSPYADYLLPPLESGSGDSVTVNHLGVSTLLISDGTTSLMIDGFFSRPSLLSVLMGLPVEPDREAIKEALDRASVDELAAVMTVHSHYDHAMDAAEVAGLTGALLVGSQSTANIGRGWGLADERLRVAESGRAMRFGAFRVTMVRSKHFPLGFGADTIGRDITDPLVPPVAPMDYLEGGSYSILIEHERGSMLVHASAGFVEGGLDAYRADAVLLGAAGMGTRDDAYMDAYFGEVVESVGAKMVVPIHYDDFTIAGGPPLRSMPNLVDDIERSFAYLVARAKEDPSLEFAMLPPWEPVVMFE